MSTWMIFCSIWAMCAMCVVLFIRGAHPHVERPDVDARAEGVDLGLHRLNVAKVQHDDR